MHVVDALSRLRALVEDEAIAVAVDLALVGDAIGNADHPGNHRSIRLGQIVHRGNVLLGDHENMRRRDGTDVFEGHDLLIAVDLFGRNLLPEDFAEETLLFHDVDSGAEQAVALRGQRANQAERAEPLLARRGIDGDVVVAQAAHSVQVSVTDNGIGIAGENLTRIFSHGFTTKRDGHGFGLHSGALAAREMGGSLTAHSDGPGKGASFTLELPISKEAEQAKPKLAA